MKINEPHSFINLVLDPIIGIVKNHEGCKLTLIGNSELYRNLFAEWFDKEGLKLEDLPQEKKVELWEQSKRYCPEFRVEWCKAVEFYGSF